MKLYCTALSLSRLQRQPSALVASTACFPLWLKICHRHIFLTRRALPEGAFAIIASETVEMFTKLWYNENEKGGDFLKETMTKRFFAPIWRCDEIEAELERLENEGWRLEKISGFRKFKFIKASPKTTKYFLTCSFVKESGMIQTEQLLKREYKATEISGNFIEGLKTTSVYRITREADLLQRKVYRNIYLRHLVWQYILIGLLFSSISVAGIVLSLIFDGTPLYSPQNIIFAIVGICGTSSLFYHLLGWLHLQKQYAKYWGSNEE